MGLFDSVKGLAAKAAAMAADVAQETKEKATELKADFDNAGGTDALLDKAGKGLSKLGTELSDSAAKAAIMAKEAAQAQATEAKTEFERSGGMAGLLDRTSNSVKATVSAVSAAVVDRVQNGSAAEQRLKQIKRELPEQIGLTEDSKFFHWEGESGVALNMETQKIAVRVGDATKIYDFADVRSWDLRMEVATQAMAVGAGLTGALAVGAANAGRAAAARQNTGLFIKFKDIDYPEWRIEMNDEARRNRWFEILSQAMLLSGNV